MSREHRLRDYLTRDEVARQVVGLLPSNRPVFISDPTGQLKGAFETGREPASLTIEAGKVVDAIGHVDKAGSVIGVTSEETWREIELGWKRQGKDGSLLFFVAPSISVRAYLASSLAVRLASVSGGFPSPTSDMFAASKRYDAQSRTLVVDWSVNSFRIPSGFGALLDKARTQFSLRASGSADATTQCCCKDSSGADKNCKDCKDPPEKCQTDNNNSNNCSCSCT